jgi:pyrroline-5-carboxylate reductase
MTAAAVAVFEDAGCARPSMEALAAAVARAAELEDPPA